MAGNTHKAYDFEIILIVSIRDYMIEANKSIYK